MKRLALLLLLLPTLLAHAQEEPTLYLVGYAHLDTQWRWEYPQTIDEYLRNTLDDNFRLFAKYPHYVFNFSGANRYRMIQEYYPADFEKLRAQVKAGRWFPSGASMEEGDVNSPSAESIIRQILYGSRWFRRELGTTSAEYMLPDSFGFPGSIPSIVAHMGLRGFSTQKLTWGSAVGVPFNIGLWEGPDGETVIAAFNPGSYGSEITYDLREGKAPIDWPARVRGNGVPVDYHYYGTGDVGGAPSESSVARVEAMVTDQRPNLRIVSATADQMFLDIHRFYKDTSKLPRYKGELELTEHSAGSLTSQAYQKRWNRKNELLADAAERASVVAMWLGRPYPQQRLENAWTLVMGGQFHDIAAGTSTPKAHSYSWNDDVLALNQFASVLTSATETVASALDTRAQGTAVVVYNPLSIDREDVVEADLATTSAVRVFGPDGKEVPSQISKGKVLFLARVPSVGWAVYDVRPDVIPSVARDLGGRGGMHVLRVPARPGPSLDARDDSEWSLENAHYRIRIDENGDIASIFDKQLRKEILSAPARLALQTETPRQWPAWNMDWDDRQQPPRAYVSGPAKVRIVENGAARVALEIAREAEGSTFVQTIRLAAGDAGNRVEIANAIDWRTPSASLKAAFPLAASNAKATYNWGVGTVERGNNDPKKYEVLSHEWIDLTDAGGKHGATILTGGKYGSDKPDDRTIRLTLIYTPGFAEGGSRSYADQTSQDFGHHDFVYGLASHDGFKWGQTPFKPDAQRLEQPLIAFETTKHEGALGKSFSFLRVPDGVHVMALKKAEDGADIIVRTVGSNVKLTFPAPIASVYRVDGQERRLENPQPCTLCTHAVKLAAGPKVAPPRTQSIALQHDQRITSNDGEKTGRLSMPAEMLPRTIAYGPIDFALSATNNIAPNNAMLARGQAIALPEGATRVHLLVNADGDRDATFRIGDVTHNIRVQDWSGFIGQWDTRLWEYREEQLPPRPDAPPNAPPRRTRGLVYAGLTPGFIKPAPVAWFASHRHDPNGANEAYAYSYVFAHSLDVPANATTLTLPNDEKIRILAITTSNESHAVRPVQPLYDTLRR